MSPICCKPAIRWNLCNVSACAAGFSKPCKTPTKMMTRRRNRHTGSKPGTNISTGIRRSNPALKTSPGVMRHGLGATLFARAKPAAADLSRRRHAHRSHVFGQVFLGDHHLLALLVVDLLSERRVDDDGDRGLLVGPLLEFALLVAGKIKHRRLGEVFARGLAAIPGRRAEVVLIQLVFAEILLPRPFDLRSRL